MKNYEAILEHHLKQKDLEITCKNIADVTKEEFAKLRCDGFGASDSALLLDVSPFGTRSGLVQDKADMIFHEEISKKPSVRMGSDIEPIILHKAEKLLKQLVYSDKALVYKPIHMYGNKTNHLNINFDGVLFLNEEQPYTIVEAKAVTRWGLKYYNTDKAFIKTVDGEVDTVNNEPFKDLGKPEVGVITPFNIKEMCTKLADYYGIPVYYFTQVQQQLMGMDAEYGYLATLLTDVWEVYIYKIYKNEDVINVLKQESTKNWAMVEAKRMFKKK